MAELLLKDLDDEVLRTIELQASVTGVSIGDVVKRLLRVGLLHDGEGRTAVADHIRSMTPRSLEDSTDTIRRMRDAGWR